MSSYFDIDTFGIEWNDLKGEKNISFDTKYKIRISFFKPEKPKNQGIVFTFDVDSLPPMDSCYNSIYITMNCNMFDKKLSPQIPQIIHIQPYENPPFKFQITYNELTDDMHFDTAYLELTISMKYFKCDTYPRQIKSSYSGIIRSQNCCYVNVILQSLYHIPSFRSFIINHNSTTSVIKELRLVFLRLQEKKNSITIDGFLNCAELKINKDLMDDSHGFLLSLFNKFEKEYEIMGYIKDYFQFESGYSKALIPKEESFSLLINWGNSTSINEAIRNTYSYSEQFFLTKLPKILILHLSNHKGDKELNLEQQIDLKDFVKDKSAISQYHLAIVVVHTGSDQSGHYTVVIKPTLEQTWYEFNEENVVCKNDLSVFLWNSGVRRIPCILFLYRSDCIDEIYNPQIVALPQKIIQHKVFACFRDTRHIAHSINKGLFVIPKNAGNYTHLNTTDTYSHLYEICRATDSVSGNFRIWVQKDDNLFGEILENSNEKAIGSLKNFNFLIDPVDEGEKIVLHDEIRLIIVCYNPQEEEPLQYKFTITMKCSDKISNIITLLQKHHVNDQTKPTIQIFKYLPGKKPVEQRTDQLYKNDFPNGTILFYTSKEWTNGFLKHQFHPPEYSLQSIKESEKTNSLENYITYTCLIQSKLMFSFDNPTEFKFIFHVHPYTTNCELNQLIQKAENQCKEKTSVLLFPVEYFGEPKLNPIKQSERLISERAVFYHIYNKELDFKPPNIVVFVSVFGNLPKKQSFHCIYTESGSTLYKVLAPLNLKFDYPVRYRLVSSQLKILTMESVLSANGKVVIESDISSEYQICVKHTRYTTKNNIEMLSDNFFEPVFPDDTFYQLKERLHPRALYPDYEIFMADEYSYQYYPKNEKGELIEACSKKCSVVIVYRNPPMFKEAP